jgi:hypothetical protein
VRETVGDALRASWRQAAESAISCRMAARREDGCRPQAEGIGIRDKQRVGGCWFVEVGSVVLFGDGDEEEFMILGMLVSSFWLLLGLCIWDLSTVS